MRQFIAAIFAAVAAVFGSLIGAPSRRQLAAPSVLIGAAFQAAPFCLIALNGLVRRVAAFYPIARVISLPVIRSGVLGHPSASVFIERMFGQGS